MKAKKIILITCGILALGLGTAGIIIPVLPTTPFVIVASLCFGASSPKLYDMVQRSRYFGEFARNYREKTGVSRGIKARALIFLWIMLILTGVYTQKLWLRLLLAAVGAGVTWHILSLKSKRKDDEDEVFKTAGNDFKGRAGEQ